MRTIRFFLTVCAVCLLVAFPAMSQDRGPGGRPGGGDHGPAVGPHGGVVGPDGTLYLLSRDAAASTAANTDVFDLTAIGAVASPATAWKQTITGDVGPVLPGQSALYVVVSTVSGSGSSATRTSSILWLNPATGAQLRATTITGNIEDVDVKTVGTRDLLYVTTSVTTTTTSGSTTTISITRTVTIYAPDGSVLKTVTL